MAEWLDWLRDGIWEFVGAILSIYALYLTYRRRKKKLLDYRIMSAGPLLEEEQDYIQVFCNGKRNASVTGGRTSAPGQKMVLNAVPPWL